MQSNTHMCAKLLGVLWVPGTPIEGKIRRDIELLTFHNISPGTQILCSIYSAPQSLGTSSAVRHHTAAEVRCAEDGLLLS